MILEKLKKQQLIHPPSWLVDNTVLLVQMGSEAYAVSNNSSDIDVYGVCIPPKTTVFPHLAGHIPGFGRQIQGFEQWSEHRIIQNEIKNTPELWEIEKEMNKRGLKLE